MKNKVKKVKVEETPYGTFRVRKMKYGWVTNRSFKSRSKAVKFRNELYA